MESAPGEHRASSVPLRAKSGPADKLWRVDSGTPSPGEGIPDANDREARTDFRGCSGYCAGDLQALRESFRGCKRFHTDHAAAREGPCSKFATS